VQVDAHIGIYVLVHHFHINDFTLPSVLHLFWTVLFEEVKLRFHYIHKFLDYPLFLIFVIIIYLFIAFLQSTQDIKRVISKGRYHPSMVLWSLSDEILWPHSVESSYFRFIEQVSY
jgi:AAA+ ATPase superfamily predicted ATPase